MGVVGGGLFDGCGVAEGGEVEGAVVEVHADDVFSELRLLGHAFEHVGESLCFLDVVVVA